MWFALAPSLVLAVYNNLVNRWEPFHGWAYVPLNLAFAAIVTSVSVAALELSASELGLTFDPGATLLVVVAIAMFAVAAFTLAESRHGHRIADQRVVGMHGAALAFYVLVRIPLGTALTEELLFRGVLYAAWREAGMSPLIAALSAGLAFGLWHIQPTIDGVRINRSDASRRTLLLAVVGAVIFTALAGLGLTWLRIEYGLLAPILLHAGINSVSALAAVKGQPSAQRVQHP